MLKKLRALLFQLGSSKKRIEIARKLGVKIGEKCRMYRCSLGSEPYLISIGDHCEITENVTFVTHDGGTWIFREKGEFKGTLFGSIIIRDNCMIGINSILMPNIVIGPNSVVGAGSVVTKDVPPNSVYAGNPAKFICTREEYLEKFKKKNTGNFSDKKTQKETLVSRMNDKIANFSDT